MVKKNKKIKKGVHDIKLELKGQGAQKYMLGLELGQGGLVVREQINSKEKVRL